MLCTCPPPTAITAIPTADCIEQLDQIQKFIIQRTKSGTTLNKIVIADDNPALQATWTDLKSAVDSTKVAVSPFIVNVQHTAGEPREVGGGNESLDGIPTIKGRNPSPITGEYDMLKQTIIEVLKGYECERELSVFLINEHGWIIGKTDNTTTPDTFYGFPIRSFFTSDKQLGGYDGLDKNFFRWQFRPNFSDRLHIVVPTDFDALTEI